ncbi:MAG: glycosyltransferase family 4 protein [Gemmatimonadales bacterium]
MAKTFLLTDEFPPMVTGVARLMGEIARRYPRGELLVSTGQHRDSLETDGRFPGPTIDRLPISSKSLRGFAGLLYWSRRVVSLARSHKPRFAWSDSIRPATYPAKWAHERVGMNYGVLVHGGDLLKELHAIHHSPFARKTAKALLRSAAAVVANSNWTREQAQKVLRELGLDPLAERVKVVPLGTDPEQFRPGIDPREVRARYRLNGGRWALTVARLEPYKGVDTALRAVARVRQDGVDLHYAVVGAGKQRNAYRKLAADLRIGDAVRFVGTVPDTDLAAIYNAVEVYLGVSRKDQQSGVEGFGVALAEAAASGLPVIVGESGGLAEAVQDGETGLVVDPDDADAVVAALGRVLSDQLLARRLGQAGRKAVETYYNWGRVIRDLREIEAQVA